MLIKNNFVQKNAMTINNKKRANVTEKVSSGLRINKAADDAAGLSISEKMRAQIRALDMGERNIQDGISYVQVADGALNEVTSILHRISELSVQALNDTNTDKDRKNIDLEVQQLKKEITNIFDETAFNNIKIWDIDFETRVQIGVEPTQAVEFKSSYRYFDIDNTNKGAVPYNELFYIRAKTDPSVTEEYGARIEWTGYDGKPYKSNLIGWDVLSKENVSFKLEDYIDTNLEEHEELVGFVGDFSYSVIKEATIEDIKNAIDGVYFYSSVGSYEQIDITKANKDDSISNISNNKLENNDISFSVSIKYFAELASGRDMVNKDTTFIEPNIIANSITNVVTPDYGDTTDTNEFEFSFKMKDYKDSNNEISVTAKPYSLYYYSNDESPDKKDIWWRWNSEDENDVNKYKYKNPIRIEESAYGLNSILDALNNDGLSITKNSKADGYIKLSFKLTSDIPFNYGDKTSTDVGTIDIGIKVYNTDTEETLITRLKSVLNSETKLDISQDLNSKDLLNKSYSSISNGYAKTSMVDVPIYTSMHDVAIQTAGGENDKIHIRYQSLNLMDLGIRNSNVLNRSEAIETVSNVEKALKIINNQRGSFGAYQNQLEYAYSNNMNSSENLQQAESRIRDMDIAKGALEISKYEILEKVMLNMMAQSNLNNEKIIELLK